MTNKEDVSVEVFCFVMSAVSPVASIIPVLGLKSGIGVNVCLFKLTSTYCMSEKNLV